MYLYVLHWNTDSATGWNQLFQLNIYITKIVKWNLTDLQKILCHKNVLSLIKISSEWSHHVWSDCIFSPYMCSCICFSINVIWLWENKQGRTHRESVQGLLVYLPQLSGLKNKCHANGAPAMSCQSSLLGIHSDLLNHLKRHALLNEKISSARACV